DQSIFNLNYVQHIAATDAALHFNYRYFHDNWGIASHTLESTWIQPFGKRWTIAPKIRYYSQTAADFYTPYLITEQGLFSYVTDPVNGPIYINATSPNDGAKYYEDLSGTVTAPIDTHPASRKYGQPVVGEHGGAIVNQQTGQAVSDQNLVDSLKQDTVPFDRSKLPAYYSSDPRLSGYGTLSLGVTLTTQFSKGVSLELGYERMRHAGGLKLGGGGEDSYADFDSFLYNMTLKVDLDTVHDAPNEYAHHHALMSTHHPAPAGVTLDHRLSSDDIMVGYRYMDIAQNGNILHDNRRVTDYALINRGCESNPCYVRPTDMRMRMHMLDIMYAPNDWLTLMLMPQFMEMEMSMRLLDGSPRKDGMDAIGSAIMHSEHAHTTAGLGDTEFHALFKLYKQDETDLHFGMGLSAPTGDVVLKMRDVMANDMGYMQYGMQLGSGTWDFKPSLTYTSSYRSLSWGAQFSAAQRLQQRNASGYALGNSWQATAWGSVEFAGVTASVRGLYSEQGKIKGQFNDTLIQIGPGDYTRNSGGQFTDVGIGLAISPKTGPLARHQVGFEWLQPVADHANGYQLQRDGTLVFNWAVHL
ncbi:MAG TPA: DUF3570 domain-containing protein, partial [Pseudomonadales bacterium]|nr:DUF3570 domain-containing protein [Pseudomonadales bacterium]